jgi:hypothetical protein
MFCRFFVWRSAPLAAALSVLATFVLQPPGFAWARVQLITLPVRERVEIQLDNAAATLVEEERIVPLVKGENQVDFSWANTQIDPNTIVLRVVGPAANAVGAGNQAAGKQLEVKLLSVSYPPNESTLLWDVGASDSGSARVRISYLLGNLTKSFNYRAVASHDETTLALSQYLRLQNFANEEFGSTGLWAGFGPRFLKPIGINETKEMLVEKSDAVPVRKTYTCNPAEYDYLDRSQNKLRVPMHYVLKNDMANHLGVAPLQYGKVRIFIQGAVNGTGDDASSAGSSTAFLGEDWGKFTPVDDEMKLYLGVAQDIVVKRTQEKNERKEISGNLHDQEVVIKYEIENFKEQSVELDVVEDMRYLRREAGGGDSERDVQWDIGNQTTFDGGLDKEHSTLDRAMFHVKLPARGADSKAEKIVQKLDVVLKNEW